MNDSSQPRKSWFGRHKILTVVLAVVTIAVLGSIIGGGNADNSNGDGAASGEKTYRFNDRADKQKSDVELTLGETGSIKDMKLTVASAEYKASMSEFDTADAGKIYAAVSIALENTSDRTQPYNPFDFRVQTTGGQVLDPAITTVPILDSGDLVTGGKVSGLIVFELPVEEGHQYLIYKPGLESDRAIVQLK